MESILKYDFQMSKQMSLLQIPMSKELRDKGEKFVKDHGYSSLQEWFRVQLTGLIKGKIKIHSTISSEEYLDVITPEYEKYLEKVIEEGRKEAKSGKTHTVKKVSEMMKVLNGA